MLISRITFGLEKEVLLVLLLVVSRVFYRWRTLEDEVGDHADIAILVVAAFLALREKTLFHHNPLHVSRDLYDILIGHIWSILEIAMELSVETLAVTQLLQMLGGILVKHIQVLLLAIGSERILLNVIYMVTQFELGIICSLQLLIR